MNKKKIRIAVWGLGQHAIKNIIPAILQSADFILVGIFTRNKNTLLTTAKKYQCKYWDTELSLLEDLDVDAIYLATPIGLHFEQGCRILSTGKHLLCEKSLTHDPVLSLQLIEVAKENKCLLLETFMYIYHPQFIALKAIVTHESFGKIVNIVSNFGFPELENPGYRYNKELGGGSFLDAACYPISLVANLFDEGSLPSVVNTIIKQVDNNHVDVAGSTLLKFHDDAMAYLSWGYNRAYRNEVTIWSQKQSVYANFIFSKSFEKQTSIVCYDEFGQPTTLEIEPKNSFSQMFSHVYESLSEGRDYSKQIARQAMLMKEVLSHA